MRRLTTAATVGSLSLLGAALLAGPAATAAGTAPSATSAQGQVTVVQAVPGSTVGVTVDGKSVQRDAAVGSVLGPFTMTPGTHQITFSDVRGKTVEQNVSVKAGTSRDVVLHLPEAVQGAPEVNTYDTPMASIGAQKSRVLVAHTANVGAADVAVDGTVVFNGITNGQFAEADVPSGAHEVQLFPAGQDTKSVLGPLSLTLPAGTVTMAYAYGNAADDSMKVVSHTAQLSTTGTAAPQRIHTGTAGLATAVPSAFGVPTGQQGVAAWIVWISWMLALPTLALLGLSVVRRTRGQELPVLIDTRPRLRR